METTVLALFLSVHSGVMQKLLSSVSDNVNKKVTLSVITFKGDILCKINFLTISILIFGTLEALPVAKVWKKNTQSCFRGPP